MEILKVSSKSNPSKVAGAIANVFREQGSVEIQTIGAGSLNQAIKAINEAKDHDGPSLIIAYAPCINHGIKGGMGNSIEEEDLAVKSGYFPIFRYAGSKKEFHLDYKDPDFTLYGKFLANETRYKMINAVNLEMAKELLEANLESAKERYEYYKSLEK